MTVRRSKIRPPRPPAAMLARPGLLARLQQALASHRVVVLQAAAGYGKTTLLAAALAGLPVTTARAWVTADDGDDLERLLAALLEALDPLDLPWRRSPRTLLALAGYDDPSPLVETLAAALADSDRSAGVIVIDDLQRCTDARAQRWLDALIDELPAGWSLLIGCRGEPLLDLRRWLLRGELRRFGADELAFTTAEAQALARAQGLRDPQQVQALVRRAGGWPAALRLALAVQGRGGGAPPGGEALFEFLAGEVLDGLDAPLREFVVLCALLPELSARRCAGLTGDPDAAQHLQAMRRLDGLVTEVDDDGSLRLHDLFREALLHRLRREHGPRIPDLLRRAAAGERDPAQRVEWLLQAGDDAAAERELEACSRALITDGAAATVQALIERFPPGPREQSPRLAIVQAQLAWSRWDADGMLRALQRVPMAARQAAADDQRDLFDAYLAVAFDNAYRDADRDVLLQALQARRLAPLPQLLLNVARPSTDLHDAIARRRETIRLADTLGTADAWYQALPSATQVMLPGTTAELQHMASTMRSLSADEPNALRMWSSVLQAWLELWHGDTTAALAAVQLARQDARWDGASAGGLAQMHALAALLHAVRGQSQACQRALRAARDAEPARADARQAFVHASQQAAWRARAAVVLGDVTALHAALDDWPLPVAYEGLPAFRVARLAAQAAELALQGRLAEACAQWQALLPALPVLEGQGEPAEIRLRLAAARVSLGRVDDAAALLRPTLDSLHPRHELGPALLAGAHVLRTLAEAPWRGLLGAGQVSLMRQWLAVAERECSSAADDAAEQALSARESDVLERIALGDSNKHIARRFDLSPHTVKRHVANILDKLDLRTRGQAADWWRRQQPTTPR